MIITKRQISDDDKERIIENHGRICFATGHPIAESETVHFDHIKAFSKGNPSDISNIAPMCEKHNKEKGTLSLYDFRIKLQMNDFFSKNDTLTLQDELKFLKDREDIECYGDSISIISKDASFINIEFCNKQNKYPLYKCTITGWEYFYAVLPVDIINSDDGDSANDGLQPRYLIRDKVFNLFRHFQNNPVLQPSLCRIFRNKILTFDGQHKIAALLWNKKKNFECKVYLDPDIRILNDTNISAHDTYSQTRFYSSIMVFKLGSAFGKSFATYKDTEDGNKKSELGFYNYLVHSNEYTKGNVNKKFKSWLYNTVIDNENNKMSKFISKQNRSSSTKPITMDMVDKSIFKLMYRAPVKDDLTTKDYKRDEEIENIIMFCNFLFENALCNWDSKDNNDPSQLRLKRIFTSKSMMAWYEIVKDSILAKLKLFDSDDKEKPFYREIKESDKNEINDIISRLVDWKIWDSPLKSEIDTIIAGNKSTVKDYFKEKGLTTGYLMGASE